MKPIDRIVVKLSIAVGAAALACSAWAERTATVSGMVTDAVTHLPVQGAIVRAGNAVMRTDDSGAYELRVEAGRVRLVAFRTGYLGPNPGNEVDDEFDVRAGDRLRRDFELRPAPRIAGTITDADTGRPVSGCIVFAMRRILSMGEAWYLPSGIPTADQRIGVFEIVGLDPGSYVLEITGCAWRFYPDVGRIEMAAPIAVGDAGVAGLAVTIRPRGGHRISGTVEGGVAPVRLVRHLQGEVQTIAQTRASKEGEFEFDNVPEGEFHVIGPGNAREMVEVTDRDISGLSLKRHATTELRMTVKVWDENAKLPALPALAKSLIPVFEGEPGLYWPRLNGLPEGYAVASVLANGLPLPNGSIAIDGAAPLLTFVVTADVGTLTGKADAPHSTVIAIREPYAEFLDQASLPRARSDEAGNFVIENVAPGKYRIVTLGGEEELLSHNEKFLRRKADGAESVELK